MGLGVCGCVNGPPENGRCMACGAYGPRTPFANQPWHRPLSEEDVRRIIREELRRSREGKL